MISNINKISIIVPVYNVEKYLRECLASLVNQTLKDIEIICVDDCSTDSSLQILEEYAKKDDRIKLHKNEFNCGVGLTRNKAMDIAQGDYIMFVDPDDYIALDACEKLYNQISENNNDIVMFNYCSFKENSKKVKLNERLKIFKNIIYDKNCKLVDSDINFFITTYPCTQIYSREFLNKYDIKFSNHRLCEDDIFVIKVLLNAQSVSFNEEFFYYYRQRKNSLMKSYDNYLDTIETKNLCFDYVKDFVKLNDKPQIMNYFLDYYTDSLIYYLNKLIKGNNPLSKIYYDSVKNDFIKLQNNYSDEVIKQLKKYKDFKMIIDNDHKEYYIKKHTKSFLHKLFFLGNDFEKEHKILIIAGLKFKFNTMVKKFKKNYKENIKRIKEKYKTGKKINVIFLINENSKWKYQSLYERLEKSDEFKPVIALTISDIMTEYNKTTQEKILHDNYKFFTEKNMSVVYAWDLEKWQPIDLKKFDCDIVFYQQRYNLAEIQNIKNTSEYALTCYVPYYLPDYKVSNLDYDNKFHKTLFRHYLLNNDIKKHISKNIQKSINNTKVVGHTMLDYFYNKPENKGEYIIYAPHWSIFNPNVEDTQYISTFDKTGQIILEYAEQHKDLKWVFKPHPTLIITLKHVGWTDEEIKNYYDRWQNIGIYCNDSSYIELFFKSKCMITDCGSFLLEYFCTKKPLIHLISSHNKNKPYNFNKKIFDSFYKIRNEEELYNILDEILIKDNDYKKSERLKILEQSELLKSLASENIYNDLKKVLSE